ncbi:hypothetical protein [Cellulosilyticum sp. I15G10I2]|uniref:hypothetical protein n=1 Tax=Cellulosilyticum sp. I15G10I2 TaxID=1892843 RepID=UPI00085C4573|nr:hypothetical protein [Cellulosilyticum sp. I15G10I2]
MEQILNEILKKLDTLQNDVTSLKQGQDEIKKEVVEINRKTTVIFDQTANLTEFTTSSTEALKRIEKELNTIETVTAKNCFDITHLKAIK